MLNTRDNLRRQSDLMKILLLDHSKTTRTVAHNIIWATNQYRDFSPKAGIRLEDVSLIQPRIMKPKDKQKNHAQCKSEVFTPREIVAQMNQAVDWASKIWPTNPENWQDYVKASKLEIACGEAPFIVSRHNTLNDKEISSLDNRVGFLDRKLQVVGICCNDLESWIQWAKVAYQASYGYEWRGDNLLLARENLLLSFVDYYEAKFPQQEVAEKVLHEIAEIISWNIFQMDGMTYTVPMRKLYAKIMDWEEGKVIEFRKLVK